MNANGKGHFLKQCPCRCSCSETGVHTLVLINPLRNYAVFCVERTRASKKKTKKKSQNCCLRNSSSTRASLAGALLQMGTHSFPGVSSGGLFALFFPLPSTHPTHKRVNCQSHPWEVAKQHQLCHQALVLPQDASGSADDSAVQQENAQKA